MYSSEEVHQAAEEFLEQLRQGKTQYAAEQLEVAAIEITNLVVLKQAANPPYFYGFKPSGRPIFTHDMKIAKAFNSTCPTVAEHVERLGSIGIPVEAHLTVWREGRDV